MARGRLIDKQIYLNESLAKLPVDARYLYKGMIVHADDEGRMKASAAILKALIFPFDEATRIDTVKKWRDQIANTGVIKLYAAGGQEYLVHPNWDRWQPLRKDRAKPSDCPPGGDEPTTKRQPMVDSPQPLPNPTQPNQREGLTPHAPRTARFEKPSVETVAEYCKQRGNGINAVAFVSFYEASGWKRGKTPISDWKACVRTWEQRGNPPVAPRLVPTVENLEKAGLL